MATAHTVQVGTKVRITGTPNPVYHGMEVVIGAVRKHAVFPYRADIPGAHSVWIGSNEFENA